MPGFEAPAAANASGPLNQNNLATDAGAGQRYECLFLPANGPKGSSDGSFVRSWAISQRSVLLGLLSRRSIGSKARCRSLARCLLKGPTMVRCIAFFLGSVMTLAS